MGLFEIAILLSGYTTIPNNIASRYGFARCNCVQTARQLNDDLPYGLFTVGSKKRVVDSHSPQEGATIFTKEGGRTGHAGTVLFFDDKNVVIIESNYSRCKLTIRTLDRNDNRIIGYYL